MRCDCGSDIIYAKGICRKCYMLQYSKKWHKENKETIRLHHNKYYTKNRGVIRSKGKEYYKENRSRILANTAKYVQETRLERNAYWSKYRKHKYETDINFKLSYTFRRRINSAIREQLTRKQDKGEQLLGCTVNFFKKHIEKLWLPGMTWNNYGQAGWHIDHMKPCSLFNLADPKEQKKCFNYRNLQPLWAKDNISKGNKYEM